MAHTVDDRAASKHRYGHPTSTRITATGLPTENVGSLPRPARLQETIAACDRGEVDLAALEARQDAAARDSIERTEATGSPVVGDGEQRVSSFATYPLADTLAGTGLADHLAAGGQHFATFDDGHHRQPPRGPGARCSRASST